MNYRHAFHAGNFADVVKHAALARIVAHLKEKPAAFRVIDTHAGAGLYDLGGPEASRTGEWREGIGKLLAARACAGGARPARALSRRGRGVQSRRTALKVYPGSPALAQHWLRPQDRLIACEREPDAARALAGRHARRQSRQGGRDRRLHGAQRLCAAEGAARPGADRSAVRAAGRVRAPRAGARRRAPQMADRHLCALVSDQGRARDAKRFARRLARLGIPRILRAELTRAGRGATSVCAAAG